MICIFFIILVYLIYYDGVVQRTSASPDRKYERCERNRSRSPEVSHSDGGKRRKMEDKVGTYHI